MEELTDEELIEQVRLQDSEAMEILIVRYKNLVRKNAKALYLIGGEHDDLIQEGMIGLYKAIRDFDPAKNARFFSFANLCISRQIYTAIQASNTRKNQPLNNYISFDAAGDWEGNEERDDQWLNVCMNGSGGNPEELLIHREDDEQIEQFLSKKLSAFEMQVLKAYLEEENYSGAAKRLGKSPKTVDNALQRIRKKLAAKSVS